MREKSNEKKERVRVYIDEDVYAYIERMKEIGQGTTLSAIASDLIRDGFLARQRNDQTLDYIEIQKIVEKAVAEETSKQTNRLSVLLRRAMTEISATFMILQMKYISSFENGITQNAFRKQLEKWENNATSYLKTHNENETIKKLIDEVAEDSLTYDYKDLV